MKYKISGQVTVSCWTEVEAESEEEAKRIASERTLAEHHIDGCNEIDECWHFDNDGTPGHINVESA